VPDGWRQVVAACGGARLLWGSNYHLLQDGSYADTVDLGRTAVPFLSQEEREQMLGGTALGLWPSRAEQETLMLPKPKHLSAEYAAIWQDPSVVAAYSLRPPYPPEVFEMLGGLIVETPRAVLDLGCGTGDLARPLAVLVDRLDAVDISRAMIERGKRLPGGDDPRLQWIQGSAEDAALSPPYALVTAGESFHWMEWERLIPRLSGALTSGGMLALVGREFNPLRKVRDRIGPIWARYSRNRDYRPYDLVEELQSRGLFEKRGDVWTTAVSWRPTLDDYIECCHSQNGCSRDRMPALDAAGFDAEVRTMLLALCEEGVLAERDGRLELTVTARITWGRPLE